MIYEDCDLERVLHVEDDGDIREIARLSLETIGGSCGPSAAALTAALTSMPRVAHGTLEMSTSLAESSPLIQSGC